MKLQLSRFRGSDFEDILALLSSFIDIPKNELDGLYQFWNSKIDILNKEHWNDFAYYSKSVYSPINPETIKRYESSSLVGIDLPTMLERSNGASKCAMIVGEDPLRKSSDFKVSSEKAIIGTPYAFHSKFYQVKRTSLYFGIVEYLLSNNYSVYLTDIYKVWAKGENGKKITFKGDDKSFFKKVLQNEIKIIRPDCCITFGKSAKKFLSKDIDLVGSKQINFPHPSNKSRKWPEILKEKATNQAKLNYFKQQLDKLCIKANPTLQGTCC